jgi:hypothetical protein
VRNPASHRHDLADAFTATEITPELRKKTPDRVHTKPPICAANRQNSVGTHGGSVLALTVPQ